MFSAAWKASEHRDGPVLSDLSERCGAQNRAPASGLRSDYDSTEMLIFFKVYHFFKIVFIFWKRFRFTEFPNPHLHAHTAPHRQLPTRTQPLTVSSPRIAFLVEECLCVTPRGKDAFSEAVPTPESQPPTPILRGSRPSPYTVTWGLGLLPWWWVTLSLLWAVTRCVL